MIFRYSWKYFTHLINGFNSARENIHFVNLKLYQQIFIDYFMFGTYDLGISTSTKKLDLEITGSSLQQLQVLILKNWQLKLVISTYFG
jgi:hypothetical protein